LFDTPERPDAAALRVCGEQVQALSEGALYWPSRNLLIVADLHFKKGSAYAARGVHLPPYDTSATLTRLKPEKIIALGDSFHDGGAKSCIALADAAHTCALTTATSWIWITGNHDPSPDGFGGLNVCDPAYAGLFAGGAFHAWMIGRDQVVPVAAKRLLCD